MMKQDNFLENIFKAAAKIRWGQNMLWLKGEHGALLFHDLQVFCTSFAIGRGFDPTGAGDTFAGGFAGFITQSENVSFENMKNAIIYGSNLASFVSKFGTERMISLDKNEVVSRLKQFKS
jgi:sugar/nucleoside kinase (ribokinase family)